MALRKCRDCGHDVSDLAPACPNCGRPQSASARRRQGGAALLLVVGAVMVAGVWFAFSRGAVTQRVRPEPPTIAAEDAVRALFVEGSQLFDPHSARFRDLSYSPPSGPSGATKWCGEVNAKNRLGAYVGWRRFDAKSGPRGVEINVYDRTPADAGTTEFLHEMACRGTYSAPERVPM